jgi:choice-of-anchor A domain-containing protein
MRIARLLTTISIAIVALGAVTARAVTPYPDTLPDGSINTGSASFFTVLAKGDPGFTDNTITGPSFVTGNIGIGGQGKFTMSDGDVFGDVVMHSGAQFKTSGPAKIHGTVSNNDAQLNGALADAQSLSDAAALEAVTPAYASLTSVNITNVNQSMTITGGPNQKVVLKLTDFVMSAGTFTLEGTATTSFIINVSKNFSLNNSSIVLSGGVPPANVLFNIRGTGGQVSLNQGTQLPGTLLALNRKVDLSGGHVTGKVIADQVVITSGGSVVSPTRNP